MAVTQIARGALLTAALLGLLTLAAVGAASSSGAPLARAAGSCNISGRQQSLGPTYVTYVGVSGTSCSRALRLVKSFYRCRLSHGGVKGHCSSVEGFRCSENRFAAISVQYDSHVLCTRGRERIRHDYTQFT